MDVTTNTLGWFEPGDYGADLTGVEDSTQAIQAAIDAADPGSVVYFPTGRYRVTSTIRVSKPLTLRGDGPVAYSYGNFGASQYAQEPTVGSTLVVEATTGPAIEHSPATTFRLFDLALRGVGDSSRTTLGIRAGQFVTLRGVRVSNFQVGIALESALCSTIDDVSVFGCDLGLVLSGAANTFTNFNAVSCGDALVLSQASKNVWLGGSVQRAARNGVILTNGSEMNSFRDVYFSGNKTLAVDVRGGDGTALDGCHFGTQGDGVRIASSWCRIVPSKYAGPLTILPSAGMTQVQGPWLGQIKDQGSRTNFLVRV